jgi:hypothetical protein
MLFMSTGKNVFTHFHVMASKKDEGGYTPDKKLTEEAIHHSL